MNSHQDTSFIMAVICQLDYQPQFLRGGLGRAKKAIIGAAAAPQNTQDHWLCILDESRAPTPNYQHDYT